jgi:DNA mismatch repair protein MLH3
MSLLTITSHHHEHRSHNSITFHHSKAIARQLPAPSHLQLSHQKHGTRVTVRNLFGNLPVRVKQRAVVVEHKAEHNRLWDTLRKEITGLMLSWRRPIFLKVRDSDNQTVLNFNNSTTSASTPSDTSIKSKPRSNELRFALGVLTQSSYIKIDEWPAWVPVTASTSNIAIKGAISLNPAPTKRIQFISLEIRPLSSDAGHNVLYDEINRIFALSSFGTIEDDADIDETEKFRRHNDRRFKSDGYTNRQLKGRKGVDRFPMFHLRISLKDGRTTDGFDDKFLENETNLQAVTDVLNAMITQWLSAHHFRPRKRNGRQDRPGTALASSPTSEIERQKTTPTPGSSTPSNLQTIGCEPLGLGVSEGPSAASKSRKRKRPTTAQSTATSGRIVHQPFAEWSRIKSGKAGFFENLRIAGKQGKQACLPQEQSNERSSASKALAVFDTEPIFPGALNSCSGNHNFPRHSSHSSGNETCTNENPRDYTVAWIDSTTKQTLKLNARTGHVMPTDTTRPNTVSSSQSLANSLKQASKSLRIKPTSAEKEDGKNPWLKGLLQTWDNPIYNPAETRIQQVSLEAQQMDNGAYKHRSHSGCSRIDMDKAFYESSLSSGNKLSKTSLQNARVIAQLDKKFILVKMAGPSSNHEEGGVLVIIDQHAADERIRVEALFAELCAPLPNQHSHSQYRSGLGHKSLVASTVFEKPLQFTVSTQEQEQFTRHASRFAAWGILYDTSITLAPTTLGSTTGKSESTLSVAALPPSIAERYKASPQLLISLLRSTVWKYAEDPHLSHLRDPVPPKNEDEESPLWLRRLATCPKGLIDSVNSRACRSAIMFNDELSMQQCEDLLARLSRCVFPFMCAHGRPSMVPLVDLGHAGNEGLGLGFGTDAPKTAEKSFVDAWKQWKAR